MVRNSFVAEVTFKEDHPMTADTQDDPIANEPQEGFSLEKYFAIS